MSIKDRILQRGVPDWSNILKSSNVSASGDLGELAARLGSPVRFDRRGDVVFYDSFEYGLNAWQFFDLPPDSVFTLSTGGPRTGGYCCQLDLAALNSASGSLSNSFALPAVTRVGLEYSVCMSIIGVTTHWIISPSDGHNQVDHEIIWTPSDGTLKARTGLATFVTFATGIFTQAGAPYYHTGKLVVDMLSGHYVRFMLDGHDYDLSSLQGYAHTPLLQPSMTVTIQSDGTVVMPTFVFYDDVILTYNEP